MYFVILKITNWGREIKQSALLSVLRTKATIGFKKERYSSTTIPFLIVNNGDYIEKAMSFFW